MVRLTLSAWLGGITLTGLLVAAAPRVAADPVDEAGSRVRSRVHGCCGDDTPLPKPPRPHPIDESPERPAPRPPRVSRAPRLPVDTADPPPAVTGSPDRNAVRRGARQFRTLVDQRRVRLINEIRDRAQIASLSIEGLFQWPAPPGPSIQRDRSADADTSEAATSDDLALPPLDRSDRPGRGLRSSPPPPVGPDADSALSDSAPPVKSIRIVQPPFITEPPSELFTMLNALASRSTPDKPLTITSLLRPPYRTTRYAMQSPTNPHAIGIAVDIAAYGGHSISTADPEEEVQACLAILKSLAPGRYRMGLPKAPGAPRHVDTGVVIPDDLDDNSTPQDELGDSIRPRHEGPLPSRGTKRQDSVRRPIVPDAPQGDPPADPGGAPADPAPLSWPFFPPPQKSIDAQGRPVTLFANEHYAGEQYLNDPRLRKALLEARRRGVDVFALFPDGENHIHVDVRQIL